MICLSLQSGSNGNCVYVETEDARVLLDAGISGLQAQWRLAAHGRDIRKVDAVILSHDHHDHVRCAGVYQRKFGLPVYVTRRTMEAAIARCPLGEVPDVRYFRAGETLRFGRLCVETIPTPHDGADPVAFVCTAGNGRLGILTDLGHVFNGLSDVVASLDGVFLESNHDVEMLEHGPYPRFLKERIRGPGGHISNVEAADLLRSSAGPGLKWACLAHLSEQNNNPRVALDTHRRIVRAGFPTYVASRYEPTGTFVV
jgi:phosphoribosyl 1,2-cyclic phosphodiesterase